MPKDALIENQPEDPDAGGGFELNRVFVIMSLKEDMNDEYLAIREACEGLGLHPHRIDESIESENSLGEITRCIERAEFIIFDLTYEHADVYYALGYAHGTGNEAFDILLIAKQGTRFRFDITPLKVNYYRNIDELGTIVSSNLKHMVQMTR